MKIHEQRFEMVPPGALVLHPENVNQGDIGAIHESMDANGVYGAIVAQRSTRFVLAGNHRLQALLQSGAAEVPVLWVDVDDRTARRILLADNRTSRRGDDNKLALSRLLKDILADEGDLIGTGWEEDDLDDLLRSLEYKPALEPELKVKETDAEDVANAAGKLEGQFVKERNLRSVMCPNCAEEFFIESE